MNKITQTVLLVDDCLEDRETYRRYLLRDKQHTYRILEAATGQEALLLCQQQFPDVIVIDYLLPDMDGLEFLNSLKTLFGQKNLPVIILTGRGNEQIAVQAMKSGAAEYLVKKHTTPVSFHLAVQNVLEKTRLNRQLLESEGRFQATFNQAAVGIAHVGLDGQWLLVNQKLCDIVGYSREELLTLTFQDITHPDELNLDLEYVVRMLTGEIQTYSLEKRYIRKDNTYIWINLTVSLVRQGCGEPQYFISVVQDISDRKQAQAALQQANSDLERRVQERTSELQQANHELQLTLEELAKSRQAIELERQHYQDLFEFAPDGYLVTDTWGNIREANRAAATLLSIQQQRLIGKPLLVFIAEPERKGFGTRLVQLQEMQGWEVYLQPRKGDPFPAMIAVSNIHDKQGQQVGWRWLLRDISDRKQAESALKESQRWLQAVIQASPNVLYIYDLIEQRGVYNNSELYSILGYRPEEVQQMGTAVISQLMHPEDITAFREYIKVFDTAKDGEIFEFEYRMQHKNGEWRWMFSRDSVFMRTYDGKPKQILGAATDISDRKRAEEALKASEAKLNAVLDSVNAGICFFRVYSDQTLKYEYCSPGCEKIFGYTAAEFMADTKLWWSRIVPEDIETILLPGFQEIFAERPIAVEYRFFHKDGSLRWNSESVTSRRDKAADCWLVTSVVIDITAHKQAEEALRNSEERWQLALKGNNDGIWDHDLKTNQHFLSPRCREILGYLDRELNDFGEWSKRIHPDDLDAMMGAFQAHVHRQTQHYVAEYRMQCKDGSYKWILSRGQALWDEAGNPTRMVGSITDIDDRKRTEAELRQQKEILQTIFDRIPVMVILFDRNGQIQLANRELEKVLGWSQAELKEKGSNILTECYPNPEDLQKALDQIQAATGKWQDFKTRTADGRVIDTSWADVRLSDGSKIGIGQDISDRKQAEEELRRLSAALEIRVQERTQELQESEERFRSAFDNAVNGMALVSPNGHWLKVNASLCKMLDYTEQEFLNDLTVEKITHPDDIERNLNLIRQILAGEISRIQIEKRYLHKHGDIVWVICSASLVRDSQGKPLYLVVQIQDITERRAIDKMKNEFISLVSHELRTPLASIRGSLGLLAAGVLDNEPKAAKQMLEIAASESERLVRLVNDILDLERLEANKIRLNQQWCDAADLIQQAMETLRPLAEENNITISLLPSRVQIWVDQDRIIQTLVNLLSNAIKFSPAETVVTISVQDQADRVLFKVKDQGRGIPADKLESIFGRFQQIDVSDSRQKGGTGLGLAICRKIVQQHGGRIWAESIFGKGSTFYFTLPIPLE
ncbi:hybrid sensor histidine kinase/response regulator [Fischerella sp. PCC 9605]|uniref:hybrid sensor histidine kinase/response regulator n=1 Tax=Fischerella sp. PCC 9605 TaxID=1173024 RepID=UPI00047A0A78|nr:PAS domain S-box protein [Fischerella sp. PCC 9605]